MGDGNATGGWIVAIYDGERKHACIDRRCMASGEFNNLSACTSRAVDMKRWKTRAGAERAARAYEANNPGMRCEPEPYHVGGRVESVVP